MHNLLYLLLTKILRSPSIQVILLDTFLAWCTSWFPPITLICTCKFFCRYIASFLEERTWLGMEKIYGARRSCRWIRWFWYPHYQSSYSSYQVYNDSFLYIVLFSHLMNNGGSTHIGVLLCLVYSTFLMYYN